MIYSKDITAERARQLLDYDPITGILTWKTRTPDMFEASGNRSAEDKCNIFNGRFGGRPAGHITSEGYIVVLFDRRPYQGHRLAWLIFYGEFPEDELDHINGVRHHNPIENLRNADRSVNMQNKAIGRNNTSGRIGVYWHKPRNKWRAIIRFDGRRIDLGRFSSIEQASRAYLKAKKKYHRHQPIPREN